MIERARKIFRETRILEREGCHKKSRRSRERSGHQLTNANLVKKVWKEGRRYGENAKKVRRATWQRGAGRNPEGIKPWNWGSGKCERAFLTQDWGLMPNVPWRRTSDQRAQVKKVNPLPSETKQGWQTCPGPSERELNQAEGMKKTKPLQYSITNINVQPSPLYQTIFPLIRHSRQCWSPTPLYHSTSSLTHLDFILPQGHICSCRSCSSPSQEDGSSFGQASQGVPILLRRTGLSRHMLPNPAQLDKLLQGFWKSYPCFTSRYMEELLSSWFWVLTVWSRDGQSCMLDHFMSLGTKATNL